MPTVRQVVREVATKIIKASPTGIHWAELHRSVSKALPKEKKNTIQGALHNFAKDLPSDLHKPERGLYARKSGVVDSVDQAATAKYSEKDFYEPFADWLRDDVEEASIAVALGGSGLGDKWGTPDVIGLYRPYKTDAIQFTEEVVVAEIKIDTNGLIVAFGQACAYKLFAHRVYIVVPNSAPPKDLKRLDALAAVVGIGLVRFNAEDPTNPEFTVMARAAKHEPDYFYTNEMLHKCKKELGL